MLKKSEKTTKYILEKVAPLFNQKGYAATSMHDITEVTGLTKGAIYGNFRNKESLAVAAFNKNVNDLLVAIAMHQKKGKTPVEKLLLIPDFYKNYYQYSKALGGCPILNVGVDATGLHPELKENVREVIQRTQANIAKLVEWGISDGLISKKIHPSRFAHKLYSGIQGAVFMMTVLDDPGFMNLAMEDLKINIIRDFSET